MVSAVDSISQTSQSSQPPGVVELREDAPLKASGIGGQRWRCVAGPRLVAAGFAALSAAITVALLAQIYAGDYQLVPHGSVASDAEACSIAGTDALKAGGGAIDAALTAALCLAVLAPHRTSLHAGGALLSWEYRNARSRDPQLVQWSGGVKDPPGPPPLLAAVAALHARNGTLSWSRLLQPAIDATRSSQLASSIPESDETRFILGTYLSSLQQNSSAELTKAWRGDSLLREERVALISVGPWRLWTGQEGDKGAQAARNAFVAGIHTRFSVNDTRLEAAKALNTAVRSGEWEPVVPPVVTGLAAVDANDVYVALVTGPANGGEAELAPAMLADSELCGARYVVGAESWAALAQGAAALARHGAPDAVELPRSLLMANGDLVNEGPDSPALNVVRQLGDALSSHADSRSGGYASRF